MRYRFTMTSVLETDDLDLIKSDISKMGFGRHPNVDDIMGKGPILFEETHKPLRDTTTHITVEQIQ